MPQNAISDAPAGKNRRMRRVSLLKRGARTKDLILATGLLRQLAACRAPLPEGLQRMAADCPNNQVSMHLNRLAEHIQAGDTLADAMRQSPKFFPRYYVDLVEVAQTTNELDTTLSGLMHEVESRRQAGNKNRNRVAYIAILLAYVVFVSSLLAQTVLPAVEETAVSLGGQPAGPARFGKAVTDITGFLKVPFGAVNAAADDLFGKLSEHLLVTAGGILLVGGMLALIFLAVALTLFGPLSFVFERLPGVRHILLYDRWGHAIGILSLLLARGVTLDRALESAALSDVPRSVRATLHRLVGRVRSGMSLSDALCMERWQTPGSLRGAVAFGEHAGCLAETLSKVSHVYRLRAERAERMLFNVLFPLAIMGCGVLVLAVHAHLFGLLIVSVDAILGGI